MNRCVIITAGGRGQRMGGATPKQFALIGGRPVLMRSVERFYAWDAGAEIIVAIPQDAREYWTELCAEYDFAVPHRTVDGGSTRFHSVKNALSTITGDDSSLVAVHDAARPFVTVDVIASCFAAAEVHGAAIPATALTDSIRERDGNTGRSRSVDRTKFVAVQTPQVFGLGLLRRGYAEEYRPEFTDDASVVEALGARVFMVEGNAANIKLTTPFDLQIAELLLKQIDL